MANEQHSDEMKLAMTVIVEAAVQECKKTGVQEIVYPFDYGGIPLFVTVRPDMTVDLPAPELPDGETSTSWPVPGEDFVGFHACGCRHEPTITDPNDLVPRYRIKLHCPKHQEPIGRLMGVLAGVATCGTHQNQKGFYAVDLAEGTQDHEPSCPSCAWTLTQMAPDALATVLHLRTNGTPVDKAILAVQQALETKAREAEKLKAFQEDLAEEAANPTSTQTQEQPSLATGIVCPMGKEPCQLHDPACSVSPGYFRTTMHGKQVEICGDCVEESGGSIVENAMGIDRLSAGPDLGDGFRGLDRTAKHE